MYMYVYNTDLFILQYMCIIEGVSGKKGISHILQLLRNKGLKFGIFSTAIHT